MIVRRLASPLLRCLFAVFTRWQAADLENAPPTGPLVVAFNHLGHLDPALLVAALPWPLEFMFVSDLLEVPVTGQLIRLYGAIPLQRGQIDREVLRRALQVLQEGGIVALAPEARMSRTGALERGRPGAAYLAVRSGAPLLPVAVTGTTTAELLSALRRLCRPRITLTVGQSFLPPVVQRSGSIDRDLIDKLTERIMRELAGLLPPNYRGIYA